MNIKPLIAIAVLLNIAVIAWLMLRPSATTPVDIAEIGSELIATQTMEEGKYDLSDQVEELNIIVISMDALRYDYTGLAGEQGLTMNLDKFAEEATIFHDTTSAAPWTLPSHMSVWTARWPSIHQVTNKLKLLASEQMIENSLSAGISTYPDLLLEQGYLAAGFTGGAGVQSRYGFGRNFNHYVDDQYFGGFDYSIPGALKWIEEHRDQRFFLFLHGYDVHGQYPLADGMLNTLKSGHNTKLSGEIEENAKLREEGLSAIVNPGDAGTLAGELSTEDAEFLKAMYKAKIQAADQRVGSFLDQLRQMGLLDRSIVIIMSDHGDEFMEHRSIDHGATLYEEQLRVVMMMRFPGYARRHDIHTPVRTIDLFPTVFDVLGLQGSSGVDGQSLLPLMRGEDLELPIFAETDYRLYRHLRSYRKGEYKLILDLQDDGKELYHLPSDPDELNNISSSKPRETYELEQALRKWMEESHSNPQDYFKVKQKPISIF